MTLGTAAALLSPSGLRAAVVLAVMFLPLAVAAQEVPDPLERYNRAIYGFNERVDKAVLEPVAKGYRKVAPEPVRRSVRNFLGNLRSPVIFANDLLQGDRDRAGTTLARFMINSTLGVGGLFDAASAFGYQGHEDDFGSTLGTYGMQSGPYIVLPLLGPSNVRDTLGMIGDMALDPFNSCCLTPDERYARFGAGGVSLREQSIEVINDLRRNSLDSYSTVRSAYSQRREAVIRKRGNLPPPPDNSYDDIFKDPEGTNGK